MIVTIFCSSDRGHAAPSFAPATGISLAAPGDVPRAGSGTVAEWNGVARESFPHPGALAVGRLARRIAVGADRVRAVIGSGRYL
jgi:hypothetical protein